MNKIIKITIFATVSMVYTACTSSAPVLPNTPNFAEGKKDGCTTATGVYTKNSVAFNADADYKNGWFYGRKNCNPVQSRS